MNIISKISLLFIFLITINSSKSSETINWCQELLNNKIKTIETITINYLDRTSENITLNHTDGVSVFCNGILKNFKTENFEDSSSLWNMSFSDIATGISALATTAACFTYVYQAYIAKKSYDLSKKVSGASSIVPLIDSDSIEEVENYNTFKR